MSAKGGRDLLRGARAAGGSPTPDEIRWAGDRSLLLTLRRAMQVLRTDRDLATNLLALAQSDARQIIEDADGLITAVRADSPDRGRVLGDLAESIDGELEADDDAERGEATQDS